MPCAIGDSEGSGSRREVVCTKRKGREEERKKEKKRKEEKRRRRRSDGERSVSVCQTERIFCLPRVPQEGCTEVQQGGGHPSATERV